MYRPTGAGECRARSILGVRLSGLYPDRRHLRRPFRHKARSPRVRTHSFTAQPPDIRRLALATRASQLLARSPCSATPHIRFLFIGSRFTLHASSPRSVTLPQLRFTSFAVASLREDLHLQECARAGRTKKATAERSQKGFSRTRKNLRSHKDSNLPLVQACNYFNIPMSGQRLNASPRIARGGSGAM